MVKGYLSKRLLLVSAVAVCVALATPTLLRRGMIDLRRPDEAVRTLLAIRRYGAFGGLVGHAAAQYGDAPAITDDGRAPLDAPGLKLEERLTAISASLGRVAEKKGFRNRCGD